MKKDSCRIIFPAHRSALLVFAGLAGWGPDAQAQSTAQAAAAPPAQSLDTVEVTGHRQPLSDFPGAIDVIDGETLRDGQRQVSLSEALARVPGVTVLDRQNYAQDLQIQSRGFGARSTFGIRGIKLIVDGIPSSAADGQGQAANFPLGALDRIEVLRGPLALQYGNAAGGAIIGSTDLDATASAGHRVAIDAWAGDDDSYRVALRLDGSTDALRWRLLGSRFDTDGAREHSAAQRSQFDAVTQWSPREGERVRFVVNALSQPISQDPLGLTRAALSADPHGTDPAALQFDTRKRIENHQAGLRWSRDYSAGRSAWLGTYHIERDVVQYLALPVGAQVPASNAGGVIDLGRSSTGVDVGHRWSGPRGAFAVGLEASRLDEARRGYENFVGERLGVRGRLRRDEDNRIDNREVYAVGDLRWGDEWTALAAVRHARLSFRSDDHYIAPGNGDDSGDLDFQETSAAVGLARKFERGELFASLGRGFETPTVIELAYRPDGSTGFNSALSPARFFTGEIGTRWRFANASASVVLYRVEGDDEIVPAESSGGRASFANAGRTRRDGIEIGLSGALGGQWSYALVANWIRARFEDEFSYRVTTGAGTVERSVEAGNRIPGIPRADGFAELVWRDRDGGLTVATEMRASDRIFVDDRNSDATAGNVRFALRAEWRPQQRRGWHGFARIDNLFDRDYVGSVIVNEGNSRFFEPAPGRTFTIGLGWSSSDG